MLYMVAGVAASPARADEGWITPPTTRLMVGLNAERATATTVAGTNYTLSSGGFGVDVAYYLRLGMLQPFLAVGLDVNIASNNDPCMASPFDPNTVVCERAGDPVRYLGSGKAGLRVVIPSDGEPGPVGLSAGAQYLIHGIYVTSDGGEDNAFLPYGQVDWAAGSFVLSAAAGLGGYFMAEYATNVDVSIFDTIAIRLERIGWDRSESVVRGFNLHVSLGTLTFM